MQILILALILIAGLALTGCIAVALATLLAELGFLGSCFEGGCGYAALFVAFPLLWIILFASFVACFAIWRRKAKPARSVSSSV
ncbi:MAG: hypothetical protein ACRECW_07035 [Phyllobacterium sp.]